MQELICARVAPNGTEVARDAAPVERGKRERGTRAGSSGAPPAGGGPAAPSAGSGAAGVSVAAGTFGVSIPGGVTTTAAACHASCH